MQAIAKDDCTVLWMLLDVGENTLLRFWRREDFPEAWLLRAIFFFIVGGQEGKLLRGAYELSKVVTLGPESSQSRTVSFLGRTLTLRQRGIEYEPDQQHVSRALKALGLTDA